MTTTRNFPQKKYARQMSALLRLGKQADKYENAMQTATPDERVAIGLKLRRTRKEIAVLFDRTSKGGHRVSTKKVHANTGRRA